MLQRVADYEAVIPAPFGPVGVLTADGRLVDIGFLPSTAALRAPRAAFTRRVCRELERYFVDPRHPFDIPLAASGSEHARRVWRALLRIPPGEVKSYGELARSLKSSPRAIGGACRSNPIPIVIPCHRIVASSGVGGFMGKRGGSALSIKRWLLAHEQG